MSAPEWSGRLEDPVPVGARVKLTGVFLKNTGQRTGEEGAKVWTTLEHLSCPLCESGRFVAVDEYPIEELLAEVAKHRAEARAAPKPARRGGRKIENARKMNVETYLRESYTAKEIADPRAHPRHVAVAILMPEHPRTPRVRYYP